MIRGLVLDVDDTLYLERDYVRSGFRHLDVWCERELRVSGIGTRAWSLFEEGVRRTTITDALADSGVRITTDLVHEVVEQYRSHAPDIHLLPDAEALLVRAARDIPVAVVTDGPAQSQRAKVEALGLERWASTVVVTAEHGSSKPDPEMFRLATRGWTTPTDSIAYIADNPTKDFEGPLSLGWQAIRVRRAASLHQSLPTPEGVVEVGGLDGLATI